MKNQTNAWALAALTASALLASPSIAHAETIEMVTVLNGEQIPQAVPTDATGVGRFVIDTDANTMDYHVVIHGITGDEKFTHIHGPADIGSTGPILHFMPSGPVKIGTWDYPEKLEADILAGRVYVNLHSTVWIAGEVRGQIVDMVAVLDGAQSGHTSPGSGYALCMFDRCANTLDYFIEYTLGGETETVAHIHGAALHGNNGGVRHGLPATSGTKTGTWTYNESQEQSVMDGRNYINIHSTANPGGEIRGQITRHVVPIDGSQEVPPVATDGCGMALVAVDEDADTLSYHVNWGSLTGTATAAHIHGFAPPGANAGVQASVGIGIPVVSQWNYAAGDEASVLAGLAYFNVHSTAHGGGEIRGQLTFALDYCTADVNCDGAVTVEDLLHLLGGWGPCDADPTPCNVDFNDDGMVNVEDLLFMLAAFGDCP